MKLISQHNGQIKDLELGLNLVVRVRVLSLCVSVVLSFFLSVFPEAC